MSAAVALMLEGMPSPWDLRLHRAAGRVVVLVGSAVVAEYAEGDLAMRNMVIVTLRRVGFPGERVAEVFGLTPTYVSRLKTAAARGSAAALAGQDGPGRPRALGEDKQELARQWREQGESDLEIGRRLGVAGTTVARRLAARPRQRRRMPARGRRSLSSRSPEPAGTWNWLRNPGRSPGRGQIQGRRRSNRTRSRSPDAWPGRQLSRGRAGRRSPAGCSGRGMRGRCCCMRSRPGPGRGRYWSPPPGPGAAPAVRRCGAAVGDQHVLRAGG